MKITRTFILALAMVIVSQGAAIAAPSASIMQAYQVICQKGAHQALSHVKGVNFVKVIKRCVSAFASAED